SMTKENSIAALHRVDQAADHPLAPRAGNRARDIANVSTARRGEEREADKRGETGAAVCVGQAGKLLRAADPYRAAEHALHVIGDILELRAAAREHYLAADGTGEAETFQRRFDLVGQFFDALANHHHQLRARDLHRLGALLGPDLGAEPMKITR